MPHNPTFDDPSYFVEPWPVEKLEALARDPRCLHVVGVAIRPGVRVFIVAAEWGLYTPGTALNRQLTVPVILHKGISFIALTVLRRMKTRSNLSKYAAWAGLRLERSPPMVLGGGPAAFPLQGKHVYSLVNTPGHPIYRQGLTSPDSIRTSESLDDILIEAIQQSRGQCLPEHLRPRQP